MKGRSLTVIILIKKAAAAALLPKWLCSVAHRTFGHIFHAYHLREIDRLFGWWTAKNDRNCGAIFKIWEEGPSWNGQVSAFSATIRSQTLTLLFAPILTPFMYTILHLSSVLSFTARASKSCCLRERSFVKVSQASYKPWGKYLAGF